VVGSGAVDVPVATVLICGAVAVGSVAPEIANMIEADLVVAEDVKSTVPVSVPTAFFHATNPPHAIDSSTSSVQPVSALIVAEVEPFPRMRRSVSPAEIVPG
jgi:hypothetical protein